jgi:hypothetical protein
MVFNQPGMHNVLKDDVTLYYESLTINVDGALCINQRPRMT